MPRHLIKCPGRRKEGIRYLSVKQNKCPYTFTRVPTHVPGHDPISALVQSCQNVKGYCGYRQFRKLKFLFVVKANAHQRLFLLVGMSFVIPVPRHFQESVQAFFTKVPRHLFAMPMMEEGSNRTRGVREWMSRYFFYESVQALRGRLGILFPINMICRELHNELNWEIVSP